MKKRKKILKPLDVAALYTRCNVGDLDTDRAISGNDSDLPAVQHRALEAIHFGIQMPGNDYNIFALGPPGAGKLVTVRKIIEEEDQDSDSVYDWCYVNNFEKSHQPQVVRLSTGFGRQLQKDMELLVDELGNAIPAVFDSEEYRGKIEELEQEFTDLHEKSIEELGRDAGEQGIVLMRTPGGFAFAPKNSSGEVLGPADFDKLDEEEKKRVKDVIESLQERLQKILRQVPAWRKQTREKIKQLDREVTELAVSHLIDALKDKYADFADLRDYFDTVQEDIIANVDDFRPQTDQVSALMGGSAGSQSLQRYRVNLLVDNSKQERVPVIYEDLPSHSNLLGRCEYQAYMGTLVTDFTMIKPGALHRANGGYLLLEARKLLLQPHAWESLKRTLYAGEIRIEPLERTLGFMSTATLEPQCVPLDLKVVLVGDRMIYYLLRQYDPDFADLFKVAADFDDSIERNEQTSLFFAQQVDGLLEQAGLKPMDKSAVARVIEYGARLAGDAEKLSTHRRSINDLLREADFWAGKAGLDIIGVAEVQKALDKQVYRVDRIRQLIVDEIRRGTLIIDTSGSVIGQVNALSVMQLGEFAFGRPSRVTATTRLGEGKFLDIERESELGGAIHSKGVFILSSFFCSRYAKDSPISMTASVVFEQSYGEVEGDSASLAELCAIMSSIAELPIRQSFAMTGSVNQHGQVQPIGGVNEKIEGFFDVCNSYGLTGEQAVLIPARNIKHLMLRSDVVDAVAAGKFQIYPLETVDEAMQLLMDTPAGERDADGFYPADSINGRVEARLLDYAARRKDYAQPAENISDNDNTTPQ